MLSQISRLMEAIASMPLAWLSNNDINVIAPP